MHVLANNPAIGPYAPAILRFQISFPDSYPRLPPLVTFSTDMFHPLITPLTTYMYTTDIQDNGTVSATDEERLPPGGFSLRHGFPEWFGRGRKNTAGSRRISGQKGSEATLNPADTKRIGPPSKPAPADEAPIYAQTNRKHVSTYEVLRYIRSTFDDGEVLDSVPLAAAGNPGAWHAWRTHRRATGKLAEKKTEDDTKEQPEKEETKETEAEVEASPESKPQKVPPPTAKHPGEWNWEGVWEDRVKKGIAQSLSEPVLYGATSASDEMVCHQCDMIFWRALSN